MHRATTTAEVPLFLIHKAPAADVSFQVPPRRVLNAFL